MHDAESLCYQSSCMRLYQHSNCIRRKDERSHLEIWKYNANVWQSTRRSFFFLMAEEQQHARAGWFELNCWIAMHLKCQFNLSTVRWGSSAYVIFHLWYLFSYKWEKYDFYSVCFLGLDEATVKKWLQKTMPFQRYQQAKTTFLGQTGSNSL